MAGQKGKNESSEKTAILDIVDNFFKMPPCDQRLYLSLLLSTSETNIKRWELWDSVIKESLTLPRREQANKNASDTDLDKVAKEALKAYEDSLSKGKHSRHLTSMARASVELDVIRCYLQGMTVAGIIEWLRRNKKVTISKSPVGRFCTALFRLGVTRYGVAKKQPAENADNEDM